MEAVVGLPKGQDMGEVSREIQVLPPVIEAPRRVFIEARIEAPKPGPEGCLSGTWNPPGQRSLWAHSLAERLSSRPRGPWLLVALGHCLEPEGVG